MQLQRSILPVTDSAALAILESLVRLSAPNAQNPQGHAQYGDPVQNPIINIQCPLGEFRQRDGIAAALNEEAEVFSYLAVFYGLPGLAGNLTISVRRDAEGGTKVTLEIPQAFQNNNIGWCASVAIAFEKAFKPYSRLNVLHDVNPIIDEFYNRMNTATVRLSELNATITRENEEYRQRLEAEADDRRRKSESERQDYLKKLEAEYTEKTEDLKEREEALEKRKKDLDDRDNTHARRQKQEDLNRRLQEYQKGFQLTRDTATKRLPVTIAFAAGLLLLAVLIGLYTWAAFQPAAPGIPFWWHPVRIVAYTGGFVGLLIYFIRWQDRWAQTHADEEFRLKRLELDGVRAGWLVEVFLEWNRENKGEMPAALIQRLGTGLFEPSVGRPEVTHPFEDLTATLLGNSSSLQFDFPGGKASLDRKGIEKTKAASS